MGVPLSISHGVCPDMSRACQEAQDEHCEHASR